MKQVKVILISEKKITFTAADDFEIDECTGCNIYKSPDGVEYYFAKDSISAILMQPMIKCEHCGQWIIPTDVVIGQDDKALHTLHNVCPICKL